MPVRGMDRFYQQAYEMLRSPKAREALDLTRERPEVLDAYGRTPFGQSCFLARRLVEAGVRFVSINFGSWDAHGNIFPSMRTKLPELDAGVADWQVRRRGIKAPQAAGAFARSAAAGANR